MSDNIISARVGWGSDPNSAIRAGMSPGLQARCATADAEWERQGEREARERQVRAEALHDRAVLAAAQEMAGTMGLPLREALRQVGHTKAEFVAQRAAMMDVQDARDEFARARRLREFEQESEGWGDQPPPPTADELLEREEVGRQAAAYRRKQAERAKIVGLARRAAAQDQAPVTDGVLRGLAALMRDKGIL